MGASLYTHPSEIVDTHKVETLLVASLHHKQLKLDLVIGGLIILFAVVVFACVLRFGRKLKIGNLYVATNILVPLHNVTEAEYNMLYAGEEDRTSRISN